MDLIGLKNTMLPSISYKHSIRAHKAFLAATIPRFRLALMELASLLLQLAA